MLRADLKESDIPGRTTIRSRISEITEDHLGKLEKEMKVPPDVTLFINA
jgi:hypothetical protein